MNNKRLLTIFLILLAVYGISKLFSGKRDRNFKTDLIKIDTSIVTSFSILAKGDSVETILTREPQGWIASKGKKTARATAESVNAFLANLVHISTDRITAKTRDKWAEYEVGEGQGTRVKVMQSEKVLEDFVAGRFNFNPQTRAATSYVRLFNEEEVYAVDGFLAMGFSQNFDNFRNKLLLKLDDAAEITQIEYKTKDSTYLLTSTGKGYWSVDNGVGIDSAQMADYLRNLKSIFGDTFSDDFDELQAGRFDKQTLTLKGNNIPDAVTITCYTDTTKEKPFIIRSSQNLDDFFASDSSGVYNTLLAELQKVIKK